MSPTGSVSTVTGCIGSLKGGDLGEPLTQRQLSNILLENVVAVPNEK